MMLKKEAYNQSLKLQLLQYLHDRVIPIPTLGNQLSFTMVSMLHGPVIIVCDLRGLLPTRKSMGKAVRKPLVVII